MPTSSGSELISLQIGYEIRRASPCRRRSSCCSKAYLETGETGTLASLDLAPGIVTAAIAILSFAMSVIALRRTSADARLAREMAHRDAALNRFVAGPIPHVSVISEPSNTDGHVLRIVVQNSGRTATTMSGGGLAFELPDGVLRHITIAYRKEERLDPEGAPRGYVLTAPVLRNVLDEAGERSEIRPFVILGTNTIYGEPSVHRALIEMAMNNAPLAPDQTFSVFDAHHDFLRDRELLADATGEGYEITDGIYRAFIEVGPAPHETDERASRTRRRRRGP
jgi:hypothetical protein